MLCAVVAGGGDGVSEVEERLVGVEAIVEEMDACGLVRDVFTYSTLCDIYADCGDVGRVFKLLGEMRRDGVSPNTRTWSSVVRACCAAGELQRGRDVLSALLRRRGHRMHVSVHLYTVLIDAYGKAGALETAFELLADMTERGYVPNAHTYSSVIHSCGRAGATDLMMEVFAAMQRAGVLPNEVTYSSIIYYAGRAGMDLSSVEEVTRETHAALMRTARESARSGLEVDGRGERRAEEELVPLARSWPKAGDVGDVFDVEADGVEGTGIFDGEVVYNDRELGAEILDVSGGAEAVALEQMPVMLSKPVIPVDLERAARRVVEEVVAGDDNECVEKQTREAELMGMLSTHASQNELFQSFLVLGEMKREGLDTKAAYNALLDVCGRVSDFGAAVSAFEAMQKDGVKPDVASYTNLVRALSGDGASGLRQKRLVHVFLIFLEMQSAGVSPDLIFMNGMIDACRQCGAADKAGEVFDSFSRLGLTPDAASYTSWVLACVACDDVLQAAAVVRRMDAAGFGFGGGPAAPLPSHAALMVGVGRMGRVATGVALADALLTSSMADDGGIEVGDSAYDAVDADAAATALLSGLLVGACGLGAEEGVNRVLRELRSRGLAATPEAARGTAAWRRRERRG
jgi:pentatricopeptide repeat protein